ncbi:MAG: DegT/DnrJ/EryC1/StrS family aminotransferase [Acidobacteriota bacterium]
MTIRVWGYLDELAHERQEIDAAIAEVLESGRLILGPRVAAFEERFAAYCGAGYGVGVGNGTDALFLALKAMGIGAGDEVITVSNTAVPTVSAIVATGATPRFVDIDPQTYLMDVEQVEAAIGERTRCVIAVHLYGQCVDMTRLLPICEEHGVRVLEDCAQAHGAEHGKVEGRGTKAGALAEAGAFSFYPTKILGGYGDCGLITARDAEMRDQLMRLRFYGMKGRYYADEDGYNSRLDELHAAILLTKLEHLDAYVDRRRQLAARYDERLADGDLADSGLILPRTAPGNRHAYYLYVVRHPERDRILEALKEHDIELNISYPWPIHTMTAYRELGYREGDLPHTELAAQEIFSLPMFPSLRDEDQERVCDVLIDVVSRL